jgi:hypothetical protein
MALLAVLVWVCLFAAACVDAGEHLTVGGDGSAALSTRILIDKEVLQASGNPDRSLDQMVESAKQGAPDATVTRITTSKQSGVETTAHYKSVDQALAAVRGDKSASGMNNTGLFKAASRNTSSGLLTHTETYSFTTNAASVPKNLTGSSPGPGIGSTGQLSGQAGLNGLDSQIAAIMGSQIKLTFALTLPGKIATANAGGQLSQDGRTATWEIPLGQPTTFSATSEPIGPPLLTIGVVAGVLVLLAAAGAGAAVALRHRSPVLTPESNPGA